MGPAQGRTPGVAAGNDAIALSAPESRAVACIDGLPTEYRLRCRVRPGEGTARYGLRLRGAGAFAAGYDLVFRVPERLVVLEDEAIECVEGLDGPIDLDVVLRGEIVDVCVDGHRCMVNRLPELKGDRLFLSVEWGSATFEDLRVTGGGNPSPPLL